MTIPNRYKDNLDDFIDSSDAESPDWPGPIDEALCNASRSKSSPTGLLKENRLDENVSDRLTTLTPKTRDF